MLAISYLACLACLPHLLGNGKETSPIKFNNLHIYQDSCKNNLECTSIL